MLARQAWAIAVLFVLLHVSGSGSSPEAPSEDACKQGEWGQPGFMTILGKRPELILLGDSITEQAIDAGGWQTLLASKYGRKADIINRGFSGYNSRLGWWMVQQISEAAKQSPDTIERGKDTLLTVFFGANDSVGPHIFLHVPLEEYGDNLRKIVRRSKEVLPDVTIVLISPPPIDEEAVLRVEWLRENGRSLFQTAAYAEECGRVAEEEGVLFLDINSLMQTQPDWKAMLSDGLHLSGAGNAFLAQQFLALLHDSPTARRFHPSLLPQHMPHFAAWKPALEGEQELDHFCEWPNAQGEYCVHASPRPE